MKNKILIAGHVDLDPLGRHAISFLKALLSNPNNEIYIDNSSLLENYQILNDFFSEEINSGKLKFSDSIAYDFPYDFLIFTDNISLKPGEYRQERHLKRNAKIKICYPVYDGSVPPLHWINVINHFDICLCPSDYCVHNLRRYGVTIDSFCLECAVLIEDFLKINPLTHHKKKFRFGSIGAADFRKNIPLLMRSFCKAFSKNDEVELFIHSSYGKDLTCDNEILATYEEVKNKSNIILQLKKISHKEMAELWGSFDAYISPQTTTGYFTTPLEACAVGLPVILSNIHPHLELKKFIPEKDTLFFVKHEKISTAFHWVFDYRELGCKFDADEKEYVEAFKQVYNNRKELLTPSLVKERKENARKITAEALAPIYNFLINPKQVALAKNISHIDPNGVFFMSGKLAQKYEKYGFGHLAKIQDSYVSPRYPEEQSAVFQALEKTAVDSQKIWLKLYEIKELNSLHGSPWMQKIMERSQQYHITKMPKFIYKLFSQYCKIKNLFRKEK